MRGFKITIFGKTTVSLDVRIENFFFVFGHSVIFFFDRPPSTKVPVRCDHSTDARGMIVLNNYPLWSH